MDINLGLSAVATGVDTITATYSPAPTLVDKKILFLRTAGTNATTTPTFSPNGLTARTITKNGGDALAVGDLDGDVILMYDLANTRWELITPKVSSGTTLTQDQIDAINGATTPSSSNVFITQSDLLPTGVQSAIFKTNVNYAHTGTTNETVLYATSNLNGNFSFNDIFRILLNFNATSNTNNKTIKIYLAHASQTQGNAFSSAGTTQLLTYLATTNALMKRGLVRNIQFMNSTSSQQVVSPTTNGLDNDETALASASTIAAMTWDYATTTHLIVTGTLASAGDTMNFLHFRGQIIR